MRGEVDVLREMHVRWRVRKRGEVDVRARTTSAAKCSKRDGAGHLLLVPIHISSVNTLLLPPEHVATLLCSPMKSGDCIPSGTMKM